MKFPNTRALKAPIRKANRNARVFWLAGALVMGLPLFASGEELGKGSAQAIPVTQGKIIIVGVPGAGAIGSAGRFHRGGPIHDVAEFAARTKDGDVLDDERTFIASDFNFGAPRARADEAEGAILSIEISGELPIVVPQDFAKGGKQASALGNRVQLFTAQSPDFLNSVYNPKAATAAWPSVSNPRGISINNAFGRPWFASAPTRPDGPGLVSVIDPDGRPLNGAPSSTAGGVFFGNLTNREPQIIPGNLDSAAIGTTLLGKSPDGGGRAVFAVVKADGSLVQIHVEKGVDGLAPAGTIQPLEAVTHADATAVAPTRAGIVFNWAPDSVLYVADPLRNRIVAVNLTEDGQVFRVQGMHPIASELFDVPVDIAPAVVEVAAPGFSSNTMLVAASDLYVANRGNGTVVRIRQDGGIVASRHIEVPGIGKLGPGRINGIATSMDASKLRITISGEIPGYKGLDGAVVEVPAFGAPTPMTRKTLPPMDAPEEWVNAGRDLFRNGFTIHEGLGPLFNATSCRECHQVPLLGGTAPDGLGSHLLIGQYANGQFRRLANTEEPVIRLRSIEEFGLETDATPGIPSNANLTSVRIALPLFGAGLIDAIPDEVILAQAVDKGDGVHGRPHLVKRPDGSEKVSRFGWKADDVNLETQVAEAMRNEFGITNPLFPRELEFNQAEGGASQDEDMATLDDDGTRVRLLTAFVASLPPPKARTDASHALGKELFDKIGCTACHVPSLQAGDVSIPLYSDLLLHDMGTDLDDGIVQGQARGRDWRTTPLWGLGLRKRFLHDGRARNLNAAIVAHGGEAAASVQRYRELPPKDKEELLRFLQSL